jgi:hypothetical protein
VKRLLDALGTGVRSAAELMERLGLTRNRKYRKKGKA